MFNDPFPQCLIGRNRNHQGLAAAIVKLWEKSLVAKIAVKRGIQNTNNKLMAEELKVLKLILACYVELFYIFILSFFSMCQLMRRVYFNI